MTSQDIGGIYRISFLFVRRWLVEKTTVDAVETWASVCRRSLAPHVPVSLVRRIIS